MRSSRISGWCGTRRGSRCWITARERGPGGAVGAGLGGIDVRDERWSQLVRMSDATCTALQLTNFWQDVRRDLVERDRVYLPSGEVGFSGEDCGSGWGAGMIRGAGAVHPRVRGLVEKTWELLRSGAGCRMRCGVLLRRSFDGRCGSSARGASGCWRVWSGWGARRCGNAPSSGRRRRECWFCGRACCASWGGGRPGRLLCWSRDRR